MKYTALFGALALLPLAAQAEWRLVDDFEDDDLSNVTFKLAWGQTDAEIGIFREDADIMQLKNIQDADNHGFNVYAGFGATWGDCWASWPLTAETMINDGEFATFYWRAHNVGLSPDDTFANVWQFLLTDVEQVAVWGDCDVVQKLDYSTTIPTLLRAHDGGTYVTLQPQTTPPVDTWVHYWVVVDNRTRAWRMYFMAPGDEMPTALSHPNGNYRWNMRGTATGPLDNIAIGNNCGASASLNNQDPFLIDDIYMSPGVNLTVPDGIPEVSYTGNFGLDANGNVDTGSLLGWINMQPSATAWVWAYQLGTWVYPQQLLYVVPPYKQGQSQAALWAYAYNPTPGSASGAGTWGGYAVVDGEVDTGAWLGSINVSMAPFVYLNATETWAYISDPGANAMGAWMYVYNTNE